MREKILWNPLTFLKECAVKPRFSLFRAGWIFLLAGLINDKSIYKFGLSVCLSVCLFVSNKRQNGWTDRAQIFCGTSRDPREGLWMIKFSKICLHQNSIFKNFENPRIFFWKSAKFFCYLLTRRTPAYFISNTIFTNEI